MRKKICKGCGKLYEKGPNNPPFQCWCSLECAIKISKSRQELQEERQERKKRLNLRLVKKQERKELKAAKERLKSHSDYLKEAQASVNRYTRLRDKGKGCISCGAMPDQKYGGTLEAGHYRSRGAAGHLRFHLHNIHLQCSRCNRFLSGNVVEYRKNLIKRIGIEKVEALENDNAPKKFSKEYLKRIKEVFNKRYNLLRANYSR